MNSRQSRRFCHLLCEKIENADLATKKPARQYPMIFRRPGCLGETLWAFRPTLAGGLVFSSITHVCKFRPYHILSMELNQHIFFDTGTESRISLFRQRLGKQKGRPLAFRRSFHVWGATAKNV